MLRQELNELLTQTGPGTPMGAMFRRYWIPAMLAEELPNARLCEASHILELRFSPERLSGEIADFVEQCWAPRVRRQPRPRRKSA